VPLQYTIPEYLPHSPCINIDKPYVDKSIRNPYRTSAKLTASSIATKLAVNKITKKLSSAKSTLVVTLLAFNA